MRRLLAGLFVLSCLRSANSASADDGLPALLARARAAISTSAMHVPARYSVSGVLDGDGVQGMSDELIDGDREREDETLGLRAQRTMRINGLFYRSDADGNVRELSGSERRELITAAVIEDGSYLDHPEWFAERAPAEAQGSDETCFHLQPPDGANDVVCFDTRTALLRRRTFVSTDGTEDIRFGDWRIVEGFAFPFEVDASDASGTAGIRLHVKRVVIDPPVDDATFTLPTQAATAFASPVTLPLEARDDHLYVQVTIASKTLHFLLDTGSANIVLDRRLATALDLQTQGKLAVLAADRGGTATFAKVAAIEIGGIVLRDASVAVADLGTSNDGASHIDGILGYPFFAAAEVRIDTVAGTVTLAAPGALEPLGERLTLDLDRGIPETGATIGADIHAPVMIDTGSAASMLLYHPFAAAHRTLVRPGDHRDTTFAIGGTVESAAGTLPTLALGHILLRDVPIDEMDAQTGAFADRVDAGSIGMGVLGNYVTTIDETRRALFLAPRTGAKP